MIAVDSSALVAMIEEEPVAVLYKDLLLLQTCVVGWPTIVETHMVLAGRRVGTGLRLLTEWRQRPHVTCLAFDGPLYEKAAIAFERFGKGRHPAKLNFGDCMAYAVAKQNEVPLLFKGTDFHLTDIRTALT